MAATAIASAAISLHFLANSRTKYSAHNRRSQIVHRSRTWAATHHISRASSPQQEEAAALGEAGLSVPEAAVGIAVVGSPDSTQEAAGEAAGSSISKELQQIYNQCRAWEWKGYKINYVALVASGGPAVLLVHGFGASIGHWRRNMNVLAKDYSVYAIDLLGLGASEKPGGFGYTMETWGELLLEFIKDVIAAPTVLVGNSIGSLACLTATADAPQDLVRGAVLLNCAGGMNNKAVVDDWRLKLVTPLLWLIDYVLKQPSIASRLFNRVKSKDNLKSILSSVYCNKESVDDELVEIIQRPADDPGALDAFVAIITGPPGPTPMSLIKRIECPLLVLWGDTDSFTPVDGPVGRYFTKLPALLPSVQLYVLQDVGHCPHDDRPELVHEKLLPWLASLG